MRRLALAALALGLAACGDDDPGFEPWILDDLAPAEGLSIVTPEFEVAAGTEIQDCYFLRSRATSPTASSGSTACNWPSTRAATT